MRRILFSETDFTSLPNPPAGFKYIGFDGLYGGDEYEKVLCEKIQSNFPNINFTKKTVKTSFYLLK